MHFTSSLNQAGEAYVICDSVMNEKSNCKLPPGTTLVPQSPSYIGALNAYVQTKFHMRFKMKPVKKMHIFAS